MTTVNGYADAKTDFIRRIAQYAPEELGFLDEVHKDERTVVTVVLVQRLCWNFFLGIFFGRVLRLATEWL